MAAIIIITVFRRQCLLDRLESMCVKNTYRKFIACCFLCFGPYLAEARERESGIKQKLYTFAWFNHSIRAHWTRTHTPDSSSLPETVQTHSEGKSGSKRRIHKTWHHQIMIANKIHFNFSLELGTLVKSTTMYSIFAISNMCA